MVNSWTISVGGRLYGPYSLEQMQSFHAENRLADHSMVAREGEDEFRPASEDPLLAPLFQVEIAATEKKKDVSQPCYTGPHEEEEVSDGELNHFVIVAEMKSGSISGLEEGISNFGEAVRLAPQAWVLLSGGTINTIRNALVQKLGKLDTLFIVDASRDKAAWFNCGPETNTRIRKLWSRTPNYPGNERRAYRRW